MPFKKKKETKKENGAVKGKLLYMESLPTQDQCRTQSMWNGLLLVMLTTNDHDRVYTKS